MLLRTDKCSFAHFITLCDVAALESDTHLKWHNETTDDLIQSPFPFSPFVEDDRVKQKGKELFLCLKSDILSPNLMTHPKTLCSPEC